MVEQFIGYFSRWLAKLKDKPDHGNINKSRLGHHVGSFIYGVRSYCLQHMKGESTEVYLLLIVVNISLPHMKGTSTAFTTNEDYKKWGLQHKGTST